MAVRLGALEVGAESVVYVYNEIAEQSMPARERAAVVFIARNEPAAVDIKHYGIFAA